MNVLSTSTAQTTRRTSSTSRRKNPGLSMRGSWSKANAEPVPPHEIGILRDLSDPFPPGCRSVSDLPAGDELSSLARVDRNPRRSVQNHEAAVRSIQSMGARARHQRGLGQREAG